MDIIFLLLCVFQEIYIPLAFAVFFLSIFRLLWKIGNGSFFLELFYGYTTLTCVLMPAIGYTTFTRTNFFALLWVRYMPVTNEVYFSFVLPAVLLVSIIFFNFRKASPDDSAVVDKLVGQIKQLTLKIPSSAIVTLSLVSLFTYSISNFLPESFRLIGTFLFFGLFASLFYIVFKRDFPMRIYFIVGIILFIIFDAIHYGMFTIIAYMSGLFLILLLSGKKVSMTMKLMLLTFGIFFMSFLQLFKLALRTSKGDPSVFELASAVVTQSQHSQADAILFPMYYRMNQGYNIALVMRRIPARVDYLGGEYLSLTFASSFVPRLFWEDKPQAGGLVNMKMYTGITLIDWSTNVGPIGEAYGNFGYFGGWLYMIAFALFIRFAYVTFIKICLKRPIFFLWMPPLFFQTIYVMENDSLQAFNSLIKGAVFLFLMFKLFPSLFAANKTSWK